MATIAQYRKAVDEIRENGFASDESIRVLSAEELTRAQLEASEPA